MKGKQVGSNICIANDEMRYNRIERRQQQRTSQRLPSSHHPRLVPRLVLYRLVLRLVLKRNARRSSSTPSLPPSPTRISCHSPHPSAHRISSPRCHMDNTEQATHRLTHHTPIAITPMTSFAKPRSRRRDDEHQTTHADTNRIPAPPATTTESDTGYTETRQAWNAP